MSSSLHTPDQQEGSIEESVDIDTHGNMTSLNTSSSSTEEQAQQQEEKVKDVEEDETMHMLDSFAKASAMDLKQEADERDLIGTRTVPFVLQQQPSTLETATRGLQDALQNLPPFRRAAYDSALKANPDLVHRETPYELFLFASQYNLWLAAERLVDFWDKRRETFGEERFCRPLMDLSGNGALSHNLIRVLERGPYMISGFDQYGRLVLTIDREQLQDDFQDNGEKMKIFFLLWQLMAQSPVAVANGCIVLFCAETEHGGRGTSKIKPDGKGMGFLASNVWPVKLKGFHIVSPRKRHLLQQSIHIITQVLERFSLKGKMRLFHGRTCQEIFQEVSAYGLSLRHLPQRFGGTADGVVWFRQQKERWLEEERKQKLIERQAPVAHVSTEANESNSFGPSNDEDLPFSSQSSPPASMQFDGKRLTERKMQLICLENHQEQVLKRKLARLQRENCAAKQDQVLLQAQLVCVQYIEKQLMPEDKRNSEEETTENTKLQQGVTGWRQRLEEKSETILSRSVCDSFVSQPRELPSSLSEDQSLVAGRLLKKPRYKADSAEDQECSKLPAMAKEHSNHPPRAQVLDTDPSSVPAKKSDSSNAISLDATELNERDESSGCTDGDGAKNDVDVELLKSQVRFLQDQRKLLQQEEEFLKAAQIFGDHTVKAFEHYKDMNHHVLAEAIGTLFTSLTGVPRRYFQGPCSPERVADHVLTSLSWCCMKNGRASSEVGNQDEMPTALIDPISLAGILRALGYVLAAPPKSKVATTTTATESSDAREEKREDIDMNAAFVEDTSVSQNAPDTVQIAQDIEGRRKKVHQRRKHKRL